MRGEIHVQAFCDRQTERQDEKQCLLQFDQNGNKMIMHWKSDQVFYKSRNFTPEKILVLIV